MTRRLPALLPLLFAGPAVAADVSAVKTADRIEFRAGGELITAYTYAGTVQTEKAGGTKPLAKPFFYPVNAPGNIQVTRGWPMVRGTPGEKVDHFHQKSAWFCHGDVIPHGTELKTRSSDKRVKGVDFWAESAGHGRIVCVAVGEPTTTAGVVTVETTNEWRTPDGAAILKETRIISVSDSPAGRLISLDITLTPVGGAVSFGDTKEGSMGVRVNDEFRLERAEGKGTVTSSDGTAVSAPAKDNLSVWGKPADWHDYSGQVGGKPAGLAVFDHPANPHRSAWHTRAYGLMAANPFARAGSGMPGRKGMPDEVRLEPGQSLKLRYGVYAHAGDAAAGKVAEAFAGFAR